MECCGSIDDTCGLRRDLYIDFWMNIYNMNTSIKRDLFSKVPDINIRQYEDGHVSTMSILKSFSVSGEWCITGALVTLRGSFALFYLPPLQILTSARIMSGEFQMAHRCGPCLIYISSQHRLLVDGSHSSRQVEIHHAHMD